MNLAIIPARGGSQRIPLKNIRPFCGKPMIAWSIAAARESGLFDAILVSTDHAEVASIARDHGALVPFIRPPDLCLDTTPTMPVIRHALSWWEAERGPVDKACCIYATAPFLRPEYLRQGHSLLELNPDTEFAFSITSYPACIFRALTIKADGSIGMHWPENEMKRSQDLPAAYLDAGQFYWGTKTAFMTRRGVFSACSRPVMIPRHLVQDIDTIEDWESAEFMFTRNAASHG